MGFVNKKNCCGVHCETCRLDPAWRKRVGAPDKCSKAKPPQPTCPHANATPTDTPPKIDGIKTSCCTRSKVRYRFDQMHCPDCDRTYWQRGEQVSS